MFHLLFVASAILGSSFGVPVNDKQPFADPDYPLLGHYDTDGNFFAGDILANPNSKAAVKGENLRWDNATLIYELSSSIPEDTRSKIATALAGIMDQTCIRFKERTEERDYVAVTNQPSGCYSNLGKIGGRQQLNLGMGCLDNGIIQHEFMHALGFIHEHTRPDRNKYVYVIYPNIIPIYYTQFTRQSEDDVTELGLPYDFGSVMHYSLSAGSLTGFRTLVPRNGTQGKTVGQRDGVSDLDVQKLNKLYCSQGQQ